MTRVRGGLAGAFVLGLGFSITLSQSVLAVLTVLWLWRLRDPAARRQVSLPLLGPVLAFAGATVVSALASGHLAVSLIASKSLLLAVALWVVADLLPDAPAADRLLSGLAIVGAAAALLGLLQVLACPALPPGSPLMAWLFHRCDRARGAFSIYMTLAGVLTVLLLATAPRLLPGAARRAWTIGPWLVTTMGLAATYVRGAWLGFAAGMMTLVPLVRRGRLLVVVALAGVVALALLAPGVRHRVASMADPEEATIKERRYMVQSGLAMAREHPLLGLGPGGVKREYARYARPEAIKKRTGHLHNTPLQILVERGVVGFAAWLWIWVAFYARAGAVLRGLGSGMDRERAIVVGSLAAVTGFLATSLSEYSFGDSEVVLVLWTIAALPFVVARDPAVVTGAGAEQSRGWPEPEDSRA